MAMMKALAIEIERTRFDCPGTIRERDLLRARTNEDEAERLVRLARKAVVQGCELAAIDDDRYAVTSGTCDAVYLVDLREQTCDCPAAGICKHLALVLMTILTLPEPPAHHVARRATAARPIAETLEIAQAA